MGHAKNEQMNYMARGYSYSSKIVCAKCFGDPYLKRYIRKNGSKGVCSFCRDDRGKEVLRKVMPLEEFMPVIMQVVEGEYLTALDNAAYDSEEGKYLDKVLDPYEFVMDGLNQYMECENEKLLEELLDIFACEDRMEQDAFYQKQEERDMQEWEEFCKLVKKSRLSAEQIVTECGRKRATEHLVEIKNCMDKIYTYLMNTNLISVIRPEETIFRCGTHIKESFQEDYEIPVIPATLLGTVPASLATEGNRMSEKGDMMFYGAFEEAVAMEEIAPKAGDVVTVGRFHTNKRIKVLDFSDFMYRSVPSIFDRENREKRSQWFFIKKFVEGIAGKRDEEDKNFYKPTQVFTKYIQRKTKLSGIIYPSSKFEILYENGRPQYRKCVVLFVENRDCIECEDVPDKTRVQLLMEPHPKQFRV